MTEFSPFHLPDFQDIRERPAIRKVLDGVELNEADKMALELRAAELHSATLCDGSPYLHAVYKAIHDGFMPKEVLDEGHICNDVDFSYIAVESAAHTLQEYRRMWERVSRNLLKLADDPDALSELQSLEAELQCIAGSLLGVKNGQEDFSAPDAIVAEHIERFYAGIREGGYTRKDAVDVLGNKFRHGVEQAAYGRHNNRHVMVAYKRRSENGTEGVFKMEAHSDVYSALGAIHDAFDEAENEGELSNAEIAFADGEFLSPASRKSSPTLGAANGNPMEF